MKFLNERLRDEQEENHWLSVSDLMAGLMMVFLFIAIALMRDAFVERDKIKQVAVAYQENQVAIFDALNEEFAKNLDQWNAEIDDESLTFTFKSPDVLFQTGSARLRSEYKNLLSDFFPRYMNVLEPFRDSINEVRIEGHTNSAWNDAPLDVAYFKNMDLSQRRTRSVLEYVYLLPDVIASKEWMKSNIAAVGLSSSKLIYHDDTRTDENWQASKRVSFRVITNADIQIKRILQE
ncbi:cell envelope biogenesis protein OmpA [Oleiphilus sp. HI0079]|uniref:OmpA family protein n=2 Tax=Oleiphilus sp. HI0079 TaxID=1822254 RepID=UPI0007C32038|nr:OmpA family protein [Oleiphilus sp. HI0079]KZZ12839.1 cell envelope biogenesis protein OmpA [Oleiphilus sp. HI0079]